MQGGALEPSGLGMRPLQNPQGDRDYREVKDQNEHELRTDTGTKALCRLASVLF
jgi:hypothetical protein